MLTIVGILVVTGTAGSGAILYARALHHDEATGCTTDRRRRTTGAVLGPRVGDLWHLDGIARLIRNELLSHRQPDDFQARRLAGAGPRPGWVQQLEAVCGRCERFPFPLRYADRCS